MIHAFKMNGYNIILDQNSGCVHSVDEATYDIINMYETTPKEEIKKAILEKYKDDDEVCEEDIDLCFQDIESLIADGRLFAKDTFEDTALEFKKRQGVIKAICLHVAHGCNLNCEYCFAGKGEYGGADKGLMSFEVGKRALDFLIENIGMYAKNLCNTAESRKRSLTKISDSRSPQTAYLLTMRLLIFATRKWAKLFCRLTAERVCTTICAKRRTARAVMI